MGQAVQNLSQTVASARPVRIIGACVAADLICVAVFVVVGRISHDESLSAAGLVRTGWPFVVGVAGGYIGIALTRWPALSRPGAAVITVKTLVIGLVLRYGVARDGTPFSFVVVTVLVLGLFMFGWRAVATNALRRAHR
jgi:Protein of unknown function (DUF3054)